MNDTRTVRKRYVAVAYYVISLFVGLNKVEKRFIFGVFKLTAYIFFYNFVFRIDNARKKRFGKYIRYSVRLDFNIFFIGIYAKRNV